MPYSQTGFPTIGTHFFKSLAVLFQNDDLGGLTLCKSKPHTAINVEY